MIIKSNGALMKYRIAFLLMISSSISAKQEFTASVYWQAPVATYNAQYMFSDKDSSLMGDLQNIQSEEDWYKNASFTFKDIVEEGITDGAIVFPINTVEKQTLVVKVLLNNSVFNQSLEGPYFTNGSNVNFYITGPTRESEFYDMTMSRVRLSLLGISDGISAGVGTSFDFSLKKMVELIKYTKLIWINGVKPVNAPSYSEYDLLYLLNNQGNNIDDQWYGKSSDWDNKVSLLNPKGVQSHYILWTLATLLFSTFDSSTINKKTLINRDNFKVVTSAKGMALTTYFDKAVDFKLHLITPGKQGAVDASTSLSDVISRQKVYTQDYRMQGPSACEDNFGF